jgi:hypothetical protein
MKDVDEMSPSLAEITRQTKAMTWAGTCNSPNKRWPYQSLLSMCETEVSRGAGDL